MAFKMKNAALKKQADMAGCPRTAAKMKAESTMKMKSPMEMKKSPMEKELVGKQGNLPPELKAKIEAAPAKMRNRKGAMETEAPLKMKNMPDKPEGGGKGGSTSYDAMKERVEPRDPREKVGKGRRTKKGTGKMKKMMKGESPVKATYKQAYANLPEAKKKNYKSESDFINQAKRFNLKKYGTTEPTKTADKFTGGDKKELEKLVKPKKLTARKAGESTPKSMTKAGVVKPSKADQITMAKREGGSSARKIAAAERKMEKAAGDTSARGDRKRRKAAKKMKKAGIA